MKHEAKTPTQLLDALERIGVQHSVIFVACMHCSLVYDVKATRGAIGGLSTGLCEDCFKEKGDQL